LDARADRMHVHEPTASLVTPPIGSCRCGPAQPGGPIEVERMVNATGLIGLAGRHPNVQLVPGTRPTWR
jgi:hypothetical protein